MTEDAEKLLSQLAHGDRSEESVCVWRGEQDEERRVVVQLSVTDSESLSLLDVCPPAARALPPNA